MGDYIVSARKYRPQSFASVVGQRALTTTLLNAIRTERLAHAYLFCGPRGVGKTTCARIFAQTINCLSPQPDGEACGECDSCRSFREGRSMNILELDAASNNSVDDIRELIEQVRIPPQGGKYKVFIIDEVHMLSSQAFNAFLKTLEEPPRHVIFILATTEKHKILPTILSRCQVFDFARMNTQDIVGHLTRVAEREGYKAEAEALALIARKADGGMRDALSVFDQMASFTGGNITYESALETLGMLDMEYYFRLVDYLVEGNVGGSLLLLNEVLSRGFDGGDFIGGLASHVRQLLVSRDEVTLPLLDVSPSMATRYGEQAKTTTEGFLYRTLRLAVDCEAGYRASRQKRLSVELCLIEAAQIMGGSGSKDASSPQGQPPRPVTHPTTSPQGQAPRVNSLPTENRGVTQAASPTPQASVSPTQAVITTPQAASPAPRAEYVAKGTGNVASVSESPAPQANEAKTEDKASVTKFSERETPRRVARSLSSLRITDTDTPAVQAENVLMEGGTAVNEVSDKGHLTQDNVIQCWQRLANALDGKEKAMAGRLRGITPSLVEGEENAFSVNVGSNLIGQELESRRREFEIFVAKLAGIPSANMHILVESSGNSRQAYTKSQILESMLGHSPALRKLVKGMSLEIE